MDRDIPVFDAPEKAARGMATLLRHLEIRGRKPIGPREIPAAHPEAAGIIAAALAAGQKALDEHASKRLLSLYGIPVTREELVTQEEEAVRAACAIGFPVAAKACAWQIMHKSGKGLLALNLSSQDEVREAFQSIRAAAGADVPILIQEMVAGSREFMAGVTRFPGFGPCVLFGLGGVFAEALADRAFRAAPLSDTEAAEMLADIRAKALLSPFRGLPAADEAALTAILRAVGAIALAHPEIAEVDLNPLMIAGSRPVAADALIVLAP
jgi:acetyltransferase